ncbi:hypothetical protein TNCV_40031 [Trichonephila clavipes]|nr:hypothetical protein TNCV_40031 [Trichonephila clavipes]
MTAAWNTRTIDDIPVILSVRICIYQPNASSGSHRHHGKNLIYFEQHDFNGTESEPAKLESQPLRLVNTDQLNTR